MVTLTLLLAGSQRTEARCNSRLHWDGKGRRTLHLPAGCKAPFEGVLLDTDKAIELRMERDEARDTLRTTVTSTRAFWAEVLRHKDEEHRIEIEGERAKTQVAMDRLPKWYQTPEFVVPVTVVLTFLGVLGTVEIYRALEAE